MAKNNQAIKTDEALIGATDLVTEVIAPEVPEVEVTQPKVFNLDELMATYKTKSNVIRFLTTQGKTRSEIAKFMNIRYQHVRNVLIQPLKAPAPVVQVTEPESTTEEPSETA